MAGRGRLQGQRAVTTKEASAGAFAPAFSPEDVVRWAVLALLAIAAAPSDASSTQEEMLRTCDWCSGLSDGFHADLKAVPPNSGYFRCLGGELVQVEPCQPGLCYSENLGFCARCTASQAQRAWQGMEARMLRARRGSEPPRCLSRRMEYHNGTRWPEVNALLAFKAANRDPAPNKTLATWRVPRGGRDPHFVCSWDGVTCDRNSSAVTSLVINNPDRKYTLWGDPSIGQSIPPQFGNLTELTALDLSYNGVGGPDSSVFGGLIGSIPVEIGQLTKLSMFLVRSNALSGSIPDSLSELTQLQALSLSYNRFDGALPTGIGALTNLTSLGISFTNLTAPLPDSITALTNLNELVLRGMPLSGPLPQNIGKMVTLTYLGMSLLPNLDASLPASISDLTGLQWLSINAAPLRGSLPSLEALGVMNFLYINATSLSGPLPTNLPESLSSVFISQSKFSGQIPEELVSSLCAPGRATNLTELTIPQNSITGPIPNALSRCSALLSLDLSYNELSGAFPPTSFFSNFGAVLGHLDLSHNRLQGTIPQTLFSELSQIVRFRVQDNMLSGPPPIVTCNDPPQLDPYDPRGSRLVGAEVFLQNNNFTGNVAGLFSNITSCSVAKWIRIDVSSNRLHGELPAGLITGIVQILKAANNSLEGPIPIPKNCSMLRILDLSNNQLNGTIPPQLLRNCTDIESLDLSGNFLAGAVPTPAKNNTGASSTLAILNLSSNRLSGAIPRKIKLLKALTSLELARNNLSGPIPPQVSQIPLLQFLNASGNFLEGNLPSEIAAMRFLSSLSLQDNNLEGSIPAEIAPPTMPQLAHLDLSHNKLTGKIPFGFYNLTPGGGSSSMELDFSYNNLTGGVPGGRDGYLSSIPEALAGNPGLCGGGEYEDCPVESTPPQSLSPGQIAGMAVGVACGVALIAVAAWWFMRRRDEWANGTMLAFKDMDPPLTAKYILDVTENFGDEYLLGRGGFGSVYKATLHDGTVVAIKRLALNSAQGDEEFKAEVRCLGSLSHKNLVAFVGAYVAHPPSKERLLIYEFLSGGSLDNILVEDMDPTSAYCQWDIRRSIALDIARAMKYLHHDCKPGIIHRDMKPANVLMDEDYVARVADFGLAKDADVGVTHMTGDVLGTIGYLSPEYVVLGRMGFKSDVYAYGVTLLQIITGRKPTDEDIANSGLARWVGVRAAESILDPNLELHDGEITEVLGAIKLGMQCLARVPCDRPTMEEVVHLLENMDSFASGIKTFQKGTSFRLNKKGEVITAPMESSREGEEEEDDPSD